MKLTEQNKKYLNYSLIGGAVIVGLSSLYSIIKYRKKILGLFKKDEKIDVTEVEKDCECKNCFLDTDDKSNIENHPDDSNNEKVDNKCCDESANCEKDNCECDPDECDVSDCECE